MKMVKASAPEALQLITKYAFEELGIGKLTLRVMKIIRLPSLYMRKTDG